MNFSFVKDHKYFIRSSKDILGVVIGESGGILHTLNSIFTAVADYGTPYIRITYQYDFVTAHPVGDVTSFYLNVFDLTAMGLDSLTVNEFTSLFPLPYYSYNQGSLLSFIGNGIKTVGKNLFNSADVITGKYVNDANGVFVNESNSVATNYIEIFPNTEYKIISAQTTIPSSGMWGAWYDANKTFISGFSNYATAKTSPSNAKYMAFTISYSGRNPDYANNVMLLFNGGDETFEPYTSSTLSLPISTYFPSGMKSAGDVYDELTESKAITRIGSVDLGSLNWAYQSSSGNMYVDNVVSNRKNNLGFNAICSKYQQVNEDTITGVSSLVQDKSFAFQGTMNGRIIVRDTSYTDATVFKQAMADQNVKLYYELAIPLENYGVVDLGSLTWTYQSGNTRFNAYQALSGLAILPSSNNEVANILCAKYSTVSSNNTAAASYDLSVGLSTNGSIQIRDTNFTDATVFKESLQDVYLLYEKENPQGFTTATLVTENGEVPLANENGVLVGKCNSDVSADAGFIEGKIKLSDSDGDVYSNKIQIHVERSPQ